MSVFQNIRFLRAFNKFTESIGKGDMKSWTTSLVTLLGSAAAIYAPQAQAWLSHHTQAAAALAGLAVIIAHFIPSPLAEKGATSAE